MFEELKAESFDEREQKILKFWQENQVFENSVSQRAGQKSFTFYDGPPFATGLPHYGHLLAGTIKDVVLRYKSMKGFYAPRRFGWDCHGIPVESEIEKSFKLSGAPEIEKFGIANFNEECRKIVQRYTTEWKTIVTRMGRWVDFNHTYMTMDKTFMESVWWVFKQLFEKGFVYEGLKVMPFSAKLGTPLSNFEASENYKEIDDPSLTIAIAMRRDPNLFFLVWTTTPWTLISNLALMVGPNIEYIEILHHESEKRFILAKDLVSHHFKDADSYEILRTFLGKELEGESYQPIFDYFYAQNRENAFKVILEETVSATDGTAVVHAAPAFGEVDFYACQKQNIMPVCPINNNGIFQPEVPEYAGMHFKEADKFIIQALKKKGAVFNHATIRHRYPFCPRSDTPLMYKTVKTWFVAVEKIKDRLCQLNEQIHWTPTHIKFGRFGKWLEGARDWAISRNRYWGTPIPLWRAEDGELMVVGSTSELETLTGQKLTDLHRHFIDELKIEKNGKTFTRVPEVFDCWFESGSMPYAQNHYPFDDKELFENSFPADFIAEGIDQTRGWFYTLHILSTALFDRPAFKNVIVNGLILAENGLKMSKRLKNYPDPQEVISQYGADAIRLYMLNSPAVKADDLAFAKSGVELTLRQFILPLWNAFSFFNTYARIYDWSPGSDLESKASEPIDIWIRSLLQALIVQVEEGMQQYDLARAVAPLVGFIDQLTNWYIRRSRRRFWQTEECPDRQDAFTTLYYILLSLIKIAAPFIPFISETIYQNLKSTDMPQSVHLADFPAYKSNLRDEKLERAMKLVQEVVALGHSLRKEKQLKVRQPLQTAFIITASQEALDLLKEHDQLIKDELNVEEIEFGNNETDFVSFKAKPNFRVLGKKIGKDMPLAKKLLESLSQTDLKAYLYEGKVISLSLTEQKINLTDEDVQVERIVNENLVAANSGEVTLALDTKLNDNLISAGLAREIVNKINTMRREAKLNVTDRILVTMQTSDKVKNSFFEHEKYICEEILADQVIFHDCQGTTWDLNGESAVISINLHLKQ